MKKSCQKSVRSRTRIGEGQLVLPFSRHRSKDPAVGAECSEPKGNATEPVTMLRLPQVCKVTALCRSMVYQLEADGRFPQRVNIGVRSVAWVEAEVQAWLAQRIATCRARPAQRASATSPDRLSQPRAAASNGRILAPSRSASR